MLSEREGERELDLPGEAVFFFRRRRLLAVFFPRSGAVGGCGEVLVGSSEAPAMQLAKEVLGRWLGVGGFD